MNQHRTRSFIGREIRVLLVFLLVLFAIAFLPNAFSFNKRGAIFEKYYSDALPFDFFWLLVAIYLLRTVIVSISFFMKERKKREQETGYVGE